VTPTAFLSPSGLQGLLLWRNEVSKFPLPSYNRVGRRDDYYSGSYGLVVHVRNWNGFQSAPHSLWGVLFARHQQEREEFLRWEDIISSLETISEAATTPVPRASRPADLFNSKDGATSEIGIALIGRPEKKPLEIGIDRDGRRNPH